MVNEIRSSIKMRQQIVANRRDDDAALLRNMATKAEKNDRQEFLKREPSQRASHDHRRTELMVILKA